MNLNRWSLMWLSASVLTACGGGGSGDAGGSADSGNTEPAGFSVSAAYPHFEAFQPEGTSGHSTGLRVQTHGTPPGDVFIRVSSPSGAADPNISQVLVEPWKDGESSVRIVASDLPAGSYTGKVAVSVCADPDCTKHYRGSPLSYDYRFVFTPPGPDQPPASQIKLSAPRLLLGGMSGTPLSAMVDVTRLGADAKDFEVRVQQDWPGPSPWLHVRKLSGRSFVVIADSMPSRQYTGAIEVRSGKETRLLYVDYVMWPPEGGDRHLAVTTKHVHLSVLDTGLASTRSIGLTRPSWNQDVQISASYDDRDRPANWLTWTVEPNGDVSLSARAEGFLPGLYDATVQISGAYPSQPISLPVTLAVHPKLVPPTASLQITINNQTTRSGLTGWTGWPKGVFHHDMQWTSETMEPWLILRRSTGGPDQSTAFEVDPLRLPADPRVLDGLEGRISVSASFPLSEAPGGSLDLGSITEKVIVRRDLAHVDLVTPGHLLSGEQSTIYVRGSGFWQLATPDRRFMINGVNPSVSVNVLSDTSLQVTLPPMPAGEKTIRIDNALGLRTSAATLHVLDARAYGAASLPTGALVGGLVHDPAKRQLFALQSQRSEILRFREAATGWLRDVLPIPGVNNIGLSPDGATLVATSADRSLYLIDSSTLSVIQRIADGPHFHSAPVAGSNLAVTNSGRVLLPHDLVSGNLRVSYFDLQSRTFGSADPGQRLVATTPGVASYLASRDGNRLVLAQRGSVSATGWHQFPYTTQTFWWETGYARTSVGESPLNSVNDTGHRMALGGHVFAADFSSVGQLSVPDSGWRISAGVLSPDGNRYYGYSLPDDWQSSSSKTMPRIYVFDTSTALGHAIALPVLGKFSLPEYPTCRNHADECFHGRMEVSPDGLTLFVAGSESLLVVPVPNLPAAAERHHGPVIKRWTAGKG